MTLPPKLTREELLRIVQVKKDEDAAKEAARLAPGTCRVCGGVAAPVQKNTDNQRRFGGPPPRLYIDHYCCQDCGLLYGKPPSKTASIQVASTDESADKVEDFRTMLGVALARADAAEEAVRQVQAADSAEWADRAIVEDDDIDEAHPVRSGRHGEYGVASYLVGAKRSKTSLIALVNWLLVRIADLENR